MLWLFDNFDLFFSPWIRIRKAPWYIGTWYIGEENEKDKWAQNSPGNDKVYIICEPKNLRQKLDNLKYCEQKKHEASPTNLPGVSMMVKGEPVMASPSQ